MAELVLKTEEDIYVSLLSVGLELQNTFSKCVLSATCPQTTLKAC